MKTIKAKFNSTCTETGYKINKGDNMLYDYSTKKCYSQVSSKYLQFISDIDPAADTIQANEDAFFDNFCQANNI